MELNWRVRENSCSYVYERLYHKIACQMLNSFWFSTCTAHTHSHVFDLDAGARTQTQTLFVFIWFFFYCNSSLFLVALFTFGSHEWARTQTSAREHSKIPLECETSKTTSARAIQSFKFFFIFKKKTLNHVCSHTGKQEQQQQQQKAQQQSQLSAKERYKAADKKFTLFFFYFSSFVRFDLFDCLLSARQWKRMWK